MSKKREAHSFADVSTMDDLGKEFSRELEEFFVNYRKLTGKEYRGLGIQGRAKARQLVKSGGQ
jgi:inorganic pyrophosphatase